MLHIICFVLALSRLHRCTLPSGFTSPSDERLRSGRSRLVPLVLELFGCSSLLLLSFLFPSAFSPSSTLSWSYSSPPHQQLRLFLSPSLPLSLSLCRLPVLTSSSSFFSLRQPDYISYMSLPEHSLFLSLSLSTLSLFLPTQFTFPLLLSIPSLWQRRACTETSSCWLAKSLNMCICVPHELREFSNVSIIITWWPKKWWAKVEKPLAREQPNSALNT